MKRHWNKLVQFSSFCALSSLMSHKDTVLCIFQNPFPISRFLPADIHSNHFQNFMHPKQGTAGINRSNTAVQAVLKQPCLTGGWTGTVQQVVRQALLNRWLDRHCPTEAPAGGLDRPIQSVPGTGCTGPAGTGWTNLSNQLALASVGQCPSNHRLNSARLTTG